MKKSKDAINLVKSRFTALSLVAGDERIELPPKVLETASAIAKFLVNASISELKILLSRILSRT
ncbi:MAG: hypothetical protein NC393_12220 [Clostridium sp.]|nr:hypothetical protein [Clostridium sp.]